MVRNGGPHDPKHPCHTCGSERFWSIWLNGITYCEHCVDKRVENNPYVRASKVEESGVGSPDQFGNYFVYFPGAGWHPRGWNNENWPEDEQGWCVFESVTEPGWGDERYYDLKHNVQCRTVADAEALVRAAQYILERMRDEAEE